MVKSNSVLYGKIDEEVGGEVLFWSPTHGQRSKERPSLTYIDQLVQDTSHSEADICSLMKG